MLTHDGVHTLGKKQREEKTKTSVNTVFSLESDRSLFLCTGNSGVYGIPGLAAGPWAPFPLKGPWGSWGFKGLPRAPAHDQAELNIGAGGVQPERLPDTQAL